MKRCFIHPQATHTNKDCFKQKNVPCQFATTHNNHAMADCKRLVSDYQVPGAKAPSGIVKPSFTPVNQVRPNLDIQYVYGHGNMNVPTSYVYPPTDGRVQNVLPLPAPAPAPNVVNPAVAPTQGDSLSSGVDSLRSRLLSILNEK